MRSSEAELYTDGAGGDFEFCISVRKEIEIHDASHAKVNDV